MRYFTTAVTMVRIRLGDTPFAVGVFEWRDALTQVGVAFASSRTAEGLVEWSLEVRGVAVPGKFVIVDGCFEPVVPALQSATLEPQWPGELRKQG